MSASAILNELLTEIAPEQREAFRRDYRALTQLPSKGKDLHQFLDDFLRHTVRLFAATAGAVWFRGPGGGPLSAKAALGYEPLGLVAGYEQAHRQLLNFALTKSRAFVVQPFSTPEPNAGVSNPTDSFVVLGPIDNGGERLGLIELFLGPTPVRGRTASDRERYAMWLDHLVRFVCQGIELCFLGSRAPLQPALVNLTAAQAEIEAFQEAIRRSLEVTLNHYEGMSFGSLHNNQAFTRAVHELLEGNGLRIECPECRTPAILRCQSAGNSKTGVFLYDHYLDSGRTFHGGRSTFPRIKLVSKPPRRRAT